MESMASSTKDPDKASSKAKVDWNTMAMAGVWYLGWILANILWPNPSWAKAKRYLGPTKVELPTLPKVETIAPTVITTAIPGPANWAAASAKGESDAASPGSVPTATNCTKV